MSPLIETFSIVLFAVILILLITWIFTAKKNNKTKDEKPEKIVEEVMKNQKESQKDMQPLKEDKADSEIEETIRNAKPVITCVIAPHVSNFTKGTSSVIYTSTNTFVKDKDEKYYMLIKSSGDALFYIKDGKRKYLKKNESEPVPTYKLSELEKEYDIKFE